MPTYVFKTPRGKLIERTMSIAAMESFLAKHPSWVLDIGATHRGIIGKAHAKWPMELYAAGVHSTQVEEARQVSQRHGVPTEYNEKGNPIMRDPQHMKRFVRMLRAPNGSQMHDLNAYG